MLSDWAALELVPRATGVRSSLFCPESFRGRVRNELLAVTGASRALVVIS
jgi:hypothetical protein